MQTGTVFLDQHTERAARGLLLGREGYVVAERPCSGNLRWEVHLDAVPGKGRCGLRVSRHGNGVGQHRAIGKVCRRLDAFATPKRVDFRTGESQSQ